MLFNSLSFLIFFPIVLLVYYVIPQKLRPSWLLITSYFYYMCWNPGYVVFLIISTLSTYGCGLLVFNIPKENKRKRKLYIAICIILNLAILGFFKYFHFFINNINFVLSALDVPPLQDTFNIMLPVGISFYTFQVIGYLVDVYRKDVDAEKNIIRYSLFVSFFPQILSGPIGRAKSLIPQLYEKRLFDFTRVRSGLLRMLWGFGVKLIITDRIAILVNKVFDNYADYSGFTLVIAAVAFGLQIYCDFSSYSNIAIGAAEVLGIRLIENFKTPYLAESIADFWRRWHISLTSWFRDYIYIPLGGNRKGKWRKYLNIIIVFLVSGLWHGASWNFVIWGGLNGLFQVIGSETKALRDKAVSLFHINRNNWGNKLFRILFTFAIVDFTWVFFRADSASGAFAIFKRMLSSFNPWVLFDGTMLKLGLSQADFIVLAMALLLLLGVSIANYMGISIRQKIAEQGIVFRWILYFAAIFAVLILGVYGPAYSSSAFIYSNF